MTRTSNSHPIRVDWLPEDCRGLGGPLGMTFAPGKSAPSAYGARWERDLASDLDRLVEHYGVDCLITLLEKHELETLGIEGLFEEAIRRDIDVYWWPIVDGTAPDDEEAMDALVDCVMSRLEDGQKVVVHCRGGLGRSGTVVGCCLNAAGYPVGKALEIIRDVRPGAVETRRQEEFIASYDRGRLPKRTSGRDEFDRGYWSHLDDEASVADGTPPISRASDDESSIRYFSPVLPELSTGELVHRDEPTEQAVLETFARCINPYQSGVPAEILDETIDRAVENHPLDAQPVVAAASLARLFERLEPYERRELSLHGVELPHLRNAARRLFVASGNLEVPVGGQIDKTAVHVWRSTFEKRYQELVKTVCAEIWEGDPADHIEVDPERFFAFASPCALRLDGYRFRDQLERHDHQVIEELEERANYGEFSLMEKLVSFFVLQRGLGGWGLERSSRASSVRRVFRELFLELSTERIPREWSSDEHMEYYDEWRWGLRPVAEPFREIARRDLEEIDYEGGNPGQNS